MARPRSSSKVTPWRFALVVVAVLLLGAARPAAADGNQARTHYERGRSYFQLGEYRKAIEEFKAAHVEKNDPAYLYNIAECHRQLGETKDAVTFYRRFIGLSVPGHPLRPDAERRIVELEALPPPRVVDPQPPPPTPPTVVAPIAAPPAAAVTPPPAAPLALVPPAAAASPPSVAAPAPAPVTEPAPSSASPGPPSRVPAYVVGAAGLVALGVGTYFAFDARSQWRDSGPHCSADICDPEGLQLSRGAQWSARVADVTVGAGLVAAGVAVWLFVRAGHSAEAAPSPSPSVAHRVRLIPQLGAEGRAGLTLASNW